MNVSLKCCVPNMGCSGEARLIQVGPSGCWDSDASIGQSERSTSMYRRSFSGTNPTILKVEQFAKNWGSIPKVATIFLLNRVVRSDGRNLLGGLEEISVINSRISWRSVAK